MSVCSCSCGDDECMSMEKGPHICRTPQACCFCRNLVEYGERCYDFYWFWPQECGGHAKAHETCYELRVAFALHVCDGCYTYSAFDFDEAAQHAIAHDDDPFWDSWLEHFETTWDFYTDYTARPFDRAPLKQISITKTDSRDQGNHG